MLLLMLLPVIKWLLGKTYCPCLHPNHLLADQSQHFFSGEQGQKSSSSSEIFVNIYWLYECTEYSICTIEDDVTNGQSEWLTDYLIC